MDIIATIKQNINEERKNIIYMGIGTAAGYREPDGSLADKHYHQYPPFLQNLKNSIPDVDMHIILIDPYQENPPYMVADKGLQQMNNGQQHINIYCSPDNTLFLYVLRENIYTDAEINNKEEYINITPELKELNQYAIENDAVFIYHNFTGIDNSMLAELFDKELGEHLEHIIYGLGLREDFGCYFDLSEQCAYHPHYIDEWGNIKLFNMYYYMVNEKLNSLHTDIWNKYIWNNDNNNDNDNNNNNDNNNDIFKAHMDKMLHIIKHELNNVILQKLRTVFRLITGEEKMNELISLQLMGSRHRHHKIHDLYIKNEQYTELYDSLLTEYGKKLDIVAFCNNMDITGRDILEIIILDDKPFNWYNNVKHFL
jgi:hypothetical protein